MKLVGKIAAAVLVVLFSLIVVLRVVGLDPKERRPGLWLKGELVTTPVTDWSFADEVPTIAVQTTTPYLIAHSVTINCVTHNGDLYLHSLFRQGVEYPNGKHWTASLARNPSIRIKVGNRLFDRTATPVTDQTLVATLEEAYKKKFPATEPEPASVTHYYLIRHD
jgi:hypothetical protein